ncbi:pimeloyl-ACP methyl ester esterase BioH [Candidatus Thiosymbion oneisti]|uniref:pimeloyl-ACP methyl ester esterase BioH n=1 Tax=Candidatus Thiosymbion oneisti TaxID=589554 RepID=UPI00210C6349|nr:pimeloyl-ACP methyl ester esterase BioH [Candidatus Thiosymbion oneisti]
MATNSTRTMIPGKTCGLVLLHGWGMNAAVWEGLPTSLTDDRRQWRIELPGHGASPFEPRHDSRGAWADACLESAPERAVWIGWSLGGLIALEAALQAPERIQALVLLTTTPRFVRAPDWPAAMDADVLAQFHDGLLADPPGTLDRFLALQVMGSEAARNTLRTLRRELAHRPAPLPAALALGLDLLRDTDLRGRIGALACPTLWLFGRRDTLVPAAASEGIARLLPQARHRVIAGAAHAPFLSHPQETGEAIAGFFREVVC